MMAEQMMFSVKFLNCFENVPCSTPLIRLGKLSAETGCTIAVKAELQNPGGSVKDRAALYLIQEAEEKGGCGWPDRMEG